MYHMFIYVVDACTTHVGRFISYRIEWEKEKRQIMYVNKEMEYDIHVYVHVQSINCVHLEERRYNREGEREREGSNHSLLL